MSDGGNGDDGWNGIIVLLAVIAIWSLVMVIALAMWGRS